MFTFGTDPFTIEAWVYPVDLAGTGASQAQTYRFIYSGDSGQTDTRSIYISLLNNGGGTNYFSAQIYNSDHVHTSVLNGGVVPANRWTHVALAPVPAIRTPP